jgi:hypothetical protein
MSDTHDDHKPAAKAAEPKEPAKEVAKKSAISAGVDFLLPLALDFLVLFGAPKAWQVLTGKKPKAHHIAPLEAITKEYVDGKKDSAAEKLKAFLSAVAPELTLSDEGTLRRDVLRGMRAGLYNRNEGLAFLDWLDSLKEWQQDNIRSSHLEELDDDDRGTELAEIVKMSDTERIRLFRGTNLLKKTHAQKDREEARRKGKVLDRHAKNLIRDIRTQKDFGGFKDRIKAAFTFKLFD